MTGRERMRLAMSNQKPDRVPLMPQICAPHAIRALDLPYKETLRRTLSEPALLNRLMYDCARRYGVDGMRLLITPDPVPREEIVEDGGVVWQVDLKTGRKKARQDLEGGGWLQPLDEKPAIEDERDLDKIPLTTSDKLIAAGKLDSAAAIIREARGEMFMAAWSPVFSFQYLTVVRGKQQAMMDIIERPEFAHRVLERATENSIQAAIALAKVGADAVMIGETFGGVIGPRLFEKFCVPYMKRFVQAVKPHELLVYLHTCGNSKPLLELMADTGVDCIEPLDPLGGVSVADAKRRVGKRVALMGGVHTVKLASGTLREVEEDCARCINEGASGGGYILACGDMLPTETSAEKVRAMLHAAETIGRY